MKPEDKERLKKYKPNYNLTHEDIFGKPKNVETRVVYMDENDNVVSSEAAKKAVITRENDLDMMFEETIGYFQDPNEDSNKKSR